MYLRQNNIELIVLVNFLNTHIFSYTFTNTFDIDALHIYTQTRERTHVHTRAHVKTKLNQYTKWWHRRHCEDMCVYKRR